MKKLFITILFSILISLSYGQDMVQVAGGTFQMGSSTLTATTVKPVHTVTLSPYSIDKFETTYETWTLVRNWGLLHGYTDLGNGLNGCSGNGNTIRLPSTTGPNNPVTCVLWCDAIKWCNARSEMDSLNPVYYTDNTFSTVYRTGDFIINSDAVKWQENGYRLPTEAEWEFAARGGNLSKGYAYSGSNTIDDVAWDYQNSGTTTHPVGKKGANELGLYDMSGNVSEWCWDWNKLYDSTAQVDPRGPTIKYYIGYHRVVRGGDYVNNVYAAGEFYSYTPTIRNSLYEDAWWGFVGIRCVGAPNTKLTITNPVLNDVVLANSTYSIKWNSTSVDSIKIEYSADDGKTFHQITPAVSATVHGFAWHVPDTLSRKCTVVITNLNNPVEIAKSPLFNIKGYVLTRFKPNGDYELFDPALHAWQFANTDPNMWPSSWYSQFNYFLNKDPYTNQLYPFDFIKAPILARPSNFVDWPLFVKTFRLSLCYQNVSDGQYSPTALNLWGYYKDSTYSGSCFGFSQSCLLAFDRPDQFHSAYPEVGNFQNIHDLQFNDSFRSIIDQLYENQFGKQHQLFLNSQFYSRDVIKTLEELKTYFLFDTDDHRALAIDNGSFGAHNVVPYRLEKGPIGADGIYYLIVYDNNYPSGIWPGGNSTYVYIDSINNGWEYSPLGWKRNGGYGLYLCDPASQYLSWPVLWDPNQAKNSTLASSIRKIRGATSYLDIYNSTSSNIEITNSAGHSIGFHDNTVQNTLGDGIPIIPQNSVKQPPIGYLIPEDNYMIQMSGFTDSLADFSVLNQTGMFNYWRSDAVKTQTDHLSYDGGVSFGSTDAQTKTVNMEAITRLTGSERDFQILNCVTVQNDSIKIVTPDSNRVEFVNLGPSKIYDLNIKLAGASSSGQFIHARITVPAHSTHLIVPNWQDLSHQPVKIYIDAGNTGTISDSSLVTNEATGIKEQLHTGIPGEFSLDQNYPNPFNPTTIIRYSFPHRSHVTLEVFNTLGQQVAIMQNGEEDAGFHQVQFNGSRLASGVYFYSIIVNSTDGKQNFRETKKMLILK